MTELLTSPVSDTTSTTEQAGRRKWFLILGLFLLLLGLAGIGAETFLQLTSVLLFGPLLLASSLLQFLTGFFAAKEKERVVHYAAAGVEAVFGFLIMTHPLVKVIDMVTLVSIFLIVGGLIRLARGLVMQSRGRAWPLLAGLVALILGISVWLGGSVEKLSFVGLCIAIDFLCHGISWSVLARNE